MPQTNKILIIGPAWVGDMVMAQTLFKRLKANDPAVIIDVLAPAWSRPLLERMPEISQALVLPFSHGQLGLTQRWQLGRSLRAQQYTQAIVLPNSWKSALVPFAAGIPRRTGWLGEWRFGLLNDARRLDKLHLPLMVQRFMALAENNISPAPILDAQPYRPALRVTSDSVRAALKKFNLPMPVQPILALCPGAEFGPSKRWPSAHYAEIAQQKAAAGMQVWLFGSAKDQAVTAEIQQATGNACIDFAGRTTLGEAIDLLSLADLVVSNDSGLMHIAAALQRPLVVLYGSSSPRFTPPLSERVKILALNLACSPCFQRACPLKHHDCLNKLTPELALQAMNELVPV
jgi:heptosyltransferase-2